MHGVGPVERCAMQKEVCGFCVGREVELCRGEILYVNLFGWAGHENVGEAQDAGLKRCRRRVLLRTRFDSTRI